MRPTALIHVAVQLCVLLLLVQTEVVDSISVLPRSTNVEPSSESGASVSKEDLAGAVEYMATKVKKLQQTHSQLRALLKSIHDRRDLAEVPASPLARARALELKRLVSDTVRIEWAEAPGIAERVSLSVERAFDEIRAEVYRALHSADPNEISRVRTRLIPGLNRIQRWIDRQRAMIKATQEANRFDDEKKAEQQAAHHNTSSSVGSEESSNEREAENSLRAQQNMKRWALGEKIAQNAEAYEKFLRHRLRQLMHSPQLTPQQRVLFALETQMPLTDEGEQGPAVHKAPTPAAHAPSVTIRSDASAPSPHHQQAMFGIHRSSATPIVASASSAPVETATSTLSDTSDQTTLPSNQRETQTTFPSNQREAQTESVSASVPQSAKPDPIASQPSKTDNARAAQSTETATKRTAVTQLNVAAWKQQEEQLEAQLAEAAREELESISSRVKELAQASAAAEAEYQKSHQQHRHTRSKLQNGQSPSGEKLSINSQLMRDDAELARQLNKRLDVELAASTSSN